MPINLSSKIAPGGNFTVMVEGENLGSVAEGDMYFGTDGSAGMTRLAIGSNDEVLTLAGGVPTWAAAGGSDLFIKDEGISLNTAATSLDFVGLAVTASGSGVNKTITIDAALSEHNHTGIIATTNTSFSINNDTTGSDFAIVNEDGVGTNGQGCWLYSPTGGVTSTYIVRMPGAPGTIATESYVDQGIDGLSDELDELTTGTSNSSFALGQGYDTGNFVLQRGASGTDHNIVLQAPITTRDVTITLPDSPGEVALTKNITGKAIAMAIVFG